MHSQRPFGGDPASESGLGRGRGGGGWTFNRKRREGGGVFLTALTSCFFVAESEDLV